VSAPAHTLVSTVRRRARTAPAQVAVRYLGSDGAGVTLTVAELDRTARAVAASLSDVAPGERALLLYPPGPDFAAALLGCLYARIVAVPLPPPKPHRLKRQGAEIAHDCGAALALTNASAEGMIAHAFAGLPSLSLRTTGRVATAEGDAWDGPLPASHDPALIQYTSGSTGRPKGVVVTHANLVANIEAVAWGFRFAQADVMVTWLPHHHDMGLIGTLATPIMLGVRLVVLSPLDMLRQPIRWLRAVSRFRATVTGSPPFGYERCLSRVPSDERSGLDLSSLRLAFVGAEPIRAGLLERFCEAYRPHGFNRDAFYPCYGLAETTLYATGVTAGSGFRRARSARDTVLCGGPAPGHCALIVDPVTFRPVDPGDEGEIWLSGPSVAAGYWSREQETDAVFRARLSDGNQAAFLRTGDLGRQEPDGLVVSGRIKDLVIVAGRNHLAEDLELSVRAACPELHATGVAAFAISRTDGETLVLAVEAPDSERLRASMRQVIAAEHDLAIYDMLFVAAGRLPRTTSGKINRKGCQAFYLERRRLRGDAPLDMPSDDVCVGTCA
jgi:phthiocerol/phenolphthiocerol synthesis type-I polyketide synthase C